MYASFLSSPAALFNDHRRLRRDLDSAFGDSRRPSSMRAVAREIGRDTSELQSR